MTERLATIEVDEFLPHPPSEVWDALTSSDRLAQWLMPNDFVCEVGHRFTLDTGDWGTTHCEVLEVEPERCCATAGATTRSTPRWSGGSSPRARAPVSCSSTAGST